MTAIIRAIVAGMNPAVNRFILSETQVVPQLYCGGFRPKGIVLWTQVFVFLQSLSYAS
jgi:hypothetical protein